MKNRGTIAAVWAISVIPVIILILVYGKLPDIVPTNFGFDGAVNAYGHKSSLWLLAGLGPVMALLFQLIPRIDPKWQNYQKFQKYYDIFAVFMELFFLGMLCLVLTEILRPGTVSIGRTVTALIALLFILLGNMMGKIKHNYFFGIKTPWTLADPDVWNWTHRIGGRIWFIMGVLLLPCCLLLPEQVFFVVLMVGVLGSTVALFALSYWKYRQKQR